MQMFWNKYFAIWIHLVAMTYLMTKGEEEYGDRWLYFIDDNNQSTHILNFSYLPTDQRGLILGDVKFYLYTRRNIYDAEELFVPKQGTPINSTYFNASNDMRVITHGWLSHTQVDWVQNIKNKLLSTYDVNIIGLDWKDLASNPTYVWSALSTRYVGKRLAKLLEALKSGFKVKSSSIYLIGHSLGAQVMGYAGMFYTENIYRITGLDPARPCFEFPEVGPDFRLDKSDADFVDILHTCGGTLGYKYSHGHADFYPNSGKSPQPGCEDAPLAVLQTDACSHGRSHEFFYESIFTDYFAYPCQSWKSFERRQCLDNVTLMGYPTSNTQCGDFYLHTKNQSNYALNSEI